jgi:hypothetical protein
LLARGPARFDQKDDSAPWRWLNCRFMSANTAIIRVGRLLEIRAASGYRVAADVDALFEQITRAVGGLAAGVRVISVVDWRLCPLMQGEAAARLTERMSGNNPRVDRAAALVSPDAPTALLQFARLIRESGLPSRKMFTQPEPLIAWLDPVLAPAERHALRAFLNASTDS